MKKVTTLNELMSAIEQNLELWQEIGGGKYKVSFITILNMKLIDIIQMIKDKMLFYDTE